MRCSIGAASAIDIQPMNDNEHGTEELFFEICNHFSGLFTIKKLKFESSSNHYHLADEQCKMQLISLEMRNEIYRKAKLHKKKNQINGSPQG